MTRKYYYLIDKTGIAVVDSITTVGPRAYLINHFDKIDVAMPVLLNKEVAEKVLARQLSYGNTYHWWEADKPEVDIRLEWTIQSVDVNF